MKFSFRFDTWSCNSFSPYPPKKKIETSPFSCGNWISFFQRLFGVSLTAAAMSHRGVVKFFNSVDGYGFIRRRQSDVYVHRSDIADGKLLLRGDKVCFDVSWILRNTRNAWNRSCWDDVVVLWCVEVTKGPIFFSDNIWLKFADIPGWPPYEGWNHHQPLNVEDDSGWPSLGFRNPQVIEEDQRLVALRVTGGTGGFGLTIGSNVDRSTVKDLPLGSYKKSGEFLVFWGLESIVNFWILVWLLYILRYYEQVFLWKRCLVFTCIVIIFNSRDTFTPHLRSEL